MLNGTVKVWNRDKGWGFIVCSDGYDYFLNIKNLRVGQKIMGPVVIEERESTTFIGLGDSVIVNEVGCLVVKIANSEISSKDS